MAAASTIIKAIKTQLIVWSLTLQKEERCGIPEYFCWSWNMSEWRISVIFVLQAIESIAKIRKRLLICSKTGQKSQKLSMGLVNEEFEFKLILAPNLSLDSLQKF